MSAKICNWETWKELCEANDIDPYENVDFGIDKGGGNSEDFEYVGDFPEKEDQHLEERQKELDEFNKKRWRG